MSNTSLQHRTGKATTSERANFKLLQAKKFFAAALGILLLAVILLLLAYHVERRSTRQTASVPHVAIKLKQPISMGSAEIKLESVTLTSGEGRFKAPEGKQYAVVSIDIKNQSDKPLHILPASDMYMKSKGGELAYISTYDLSQPFRAGELSPGERIKGDLSFLISGEENYKFYIDAIWGGGVIPFDIYP